SGGGIKDLWMDLKGKERAPLGLFQPAWNRFAPVELLGTPGDGPVVNPVDVSGIRVKQVPSRHELLSQDRSEVVQIPRLHQSIQIRGVIDSFKVGQLRRVGA